MGKKTKYKSPKLDQRAAIAGSGGRAKRGGGRGRASGGNGHGGH
ncbi:MAG TPA: hypothetical protein VD998_01750 [Verrucomicrobiae bacterium]|nr:hypothetical protein [Verrucomicrobiae bacterium]